MTFFHDIDGFRFDIKSALVSGISGDISRGLVLKIKAIYRSTDSQRIKKYDTFLLSEPFRCFKFQ